MCGIAGHSCWGDYDDRLNTTLPILALHMEQRGRKSWGFTNGNDVIHKSLGEISEGLNPSLYGYKQAALHTRHPTTGNLTKDNSHPFQFGNVIGMHNGVVRNYSDIQKKYNRTCSVDSEHIFMHIAEGRDLKEINAYGAIVYWKDGILHLGRFNGGELTICKTETAWVFASTKTAIEVALRLSGLDKNTTFYRLDEDELYTIEGDTLYRIGKLEFGDYNTAVHGTWNGGGYNGYNNNYGIDWDSPGTWMDVLEGADNKVVKRVWTPSKRTPSVSSSQSSVRGFVSTNAGLTIVPKGNLLLEKDLTHKSTNERIMQLIEDAAKSINHEHKGDSWPCGTCGVKLFDGTPFYMTDDEVPQIVCEPCGHIDRGSLLHEKSLLVLPNDLGLVSSFFEGNIPTEESGLDCESCQEKLTGDEFFIHTKENEYMCVQCFAMAADEVIGYEQFIELTDDVPEEAESDLAYRARAAENLMAIQEMTEQEYVNDESPAGMKNLA